MCCTYNQARIKIERYFRYNNQCHNTLLIFHSSHSLANRLSGLTLMHAFACLSRPKIQQHVQHFIAVVNKGIIYIQRKIELFQFFLCMRGMLSRINSSQKNKVASNWLCKIKKSKGRSSAFRWLSRLNHRIN